MITREDQIEQSVQNFVKAALTTNGYDSTVVTVRDAFPTDDERATEMTKTQVALGFNFDDGGKSMELGSDLTLRVYTIEFWVFGLTSRLGRNVANVIKAVLEDSGYLIPLQDVGVSGHPVIDQLVISENRGITVARQINHNPRPWDLNVWTTIVKVEDTYFPSLVN